MFYTLKNSFTQATLGSIFWIALIISIQNSDQVIPFHYVWNILLIGLLIGFTFGVIYPYLWNYSIFKSSTNVLLSTVANVSCMFLAVTLYSPDMLNLVHPYWVGIVALTLIGHIIGFYFYSRSQNNKIKKELNKLI